jgi:hypothetical protein
MDKQTELKITIAELAAKKYVTNPRFTIHSIAGELELTSKEIFELFPNRSAILRFYYESRLMVYRHQTQSIDNYASFTLSEKLSNLFLSILDQFSENREFVLKTYPANFCRTSFKGSFDKYLKDEIREIFRSDNRISGTAGFLKQPFLYSAFVKHFDGFVLFWKKDESSMNQQTMALIDKWSSFVQELFYTKIADQAFDLGKFLLYASPLKKFIHR